MEWWITPKSLVVRVESLCLGQPNSLRGRVVLDVCVRRSRGIVNISA